MNSDPESYKKSRSLSPTLNFNIMQLASGKVIESELVLQLGISKRDSMEWDLELSRQNFVIGSVFWYLLQVFSLKQHCLK